MSKTLFKPNQVLVVNGKWYEVIANCLGAVSQTDALVLRAMSESAPSARGEFVDEMVVPAEIVEAALQGGAHLYNPATETSA